MYKACSKCGKIHPAGIACRAWKRSYNGGDERKLRSKYSWTKKSAEIRERAHYLCEVCKDQGIYTFKDIEVHHIVKVKDDESKLLDDNNLICLCKYHHMLADDYKIDKDYLCELVARREKLT